VPAGAREVASGDKALAMIRPERVKLSPGRPDNMCALPVVIDEVLFQGPVLRCLLRDKQGEEISAQVDVDDHPEGLAKGASIWAAWDPSAVWLLAPEA
jgi:ABC-type Fe3+/spermidine/putrescine transport system ATPase subunit